jgi:hypothetical protein
MDTRATSHMTSSQGNLSSYLKLSKHNNIIVGNGHSVLIHGLGSKHLETPHPPLVLNNVLHASNLIKNLVFVRTSPLIRPSIHPPLQLCHHLSAIFVFDIQANMFYLFLAKISWLNVINLVSYILSCVIHVLLENTLNCLLLILLIIVYCHLIFYIVMYGNSRFKLNRSQILCYISGWLFKKFVDVSYVT